MSTIERFIPAKRYNTIAIVLMAIGLVATVALYISTHSGGATGHEAEVNHARFWGSLLQNSVFFLLVVNAAMFFMCATTLAWGGWQVAFTRVTEAVSSCVPVIGVLALIILLAICFGDNHIIYHWSDPEHVMHDDTLQWKSGFLNKGFFATATILTIVLWSFLGWRMRKLSRSTDSGENVNTVENRKKFTWNNTVAAALFLTVFALTVLSTTPWLWVMSIDAHWYSTMFSWYNFASTFVSGIALITLFVVFLKNNGYLSIVTKEHLHDLGKFMFAFSIFWTYLWFSQFMLIWYSNQPEETVYFIKRVGNSAFDSPYSVIFWMMLVINFVGPILILMSRDSKRNYTIVTIVAILIIFGHWLDYFQMIFPGITPNKVPSILYDMGVGLGFVGIIMLVTGKTLSKYPLVAANHPFVKETALHHT